MDELPLQEFLARAQQGDRVAFRALFDALNDRLFAFAITHCGDRDTAMDLVQDTFVDLWKELPRFRYRSDGEFYGFVFLVLRRKLAKYHEAKKRAHESLDVRQETLGDADESVAIMPQYEDHRGLLKAISMLSKTSQEILALRNWSELSFSEIARTLDIGESAAKVRHHRAINELREELQKIGYE